jgi:hypothetical protein
MGPTQLAEQHGHELAPTGKSARVALRLVLLDGSFKLDSRKQLQQLAKNTAYSIHGESLASMIWFSQNPSHRSRAFTSSFEPIRRHPVEIQWKPRAAVQPKI